MGYIGPRNSDQFKSMATQTITGNGSATSFSLNQAVANSSEVRFVVNNVVQKPDVDYTATGTNHQMGTPSYMSPEQIKSTKAVDHRSDIYSLGVVLYYMVNGYGPYEGQNLSLFELYEKIVNVNRGMTNDEF